MGTRGYIVHKYRGRYYVKYNHYDSYPDGLGKDILGAIPRRGSAEYEDWLARCRREYAERESQADQRFWTIWPEEADRPEVRSPESDDGEPFELPSVWPPSNDLMIEWIYTVDLDREVFSVNNHQHFPLGQVPEDWMEYTPHGHNYEFAFDARGAEHEHGFISLELPPPSADPELVSAYVAYRPSIVRPKGVNHFPPGKRAAVFLASRLYSRWIFTIADPLDYLMPQWTADDVVFRELAFATLCWAAGFPECVALEGALELCSSGGRTMVKLPTGNGPSAAVELIPEICGGFHVPEESPWRAPSEEFFWMEGVLVHLSSHLHLPELAKASIFRLIEAGRASGRQAFHGVIMSLAHVVLVKVSPDDHVEHTQILELLTTDHPGPGWEESPAMTRDDTAEPARDRAIREPIILQVECHGDDSNQGGSEIKSDLEETSPNPKSDGDSRLEGDEKENKSSLIIDQEADAFAALAHVFEAVKIERLSRDSSLGRLPMELYCKIIDQVDYPTWIQCMNVSRAFRYQCQQRWLMNADRAVLRDDGAKCRLEVPGKKGSAKYPFQLAPALEAFSQRPRWAREAVDSTPWTPIVGHERGKRMFLPGSGFAFKKYLFGSNAPTPKS